MKPIYLLTIFCTIFISQIDAQHLEIGNKWIYDVRYHLGLGHYTERFDSIEIVSDTMINNQNYYKLVISEASPCGVFIETEYLREEEGKIYRLGGSKVHDDLMIDYETSEPYEVFYETSGQSSGVTTNVILDSTGIEILPDGSSISVKYQRIINNSSFDDNAVYKLVDKIGYIQYGFLFPNIGTGICDPFESHNLRCFISQGDTIHLTEFDCFESSVKVSTKNLIRQDIVISPNPASGKILLQGEFDQAVIFDHMGKGVRVEIDNDSSIDISSLNAGLYIIQLKKENQNILHTGRFIKI